MNRQKAYPKFAYMCLLLWAITTTIHATENGLQDTSLGNKTGRTLQWFVTDPSETLSKENAKQTEALFQPNSPPTDYTTVRDLYYIALKYSPELQSKLATLNLAYADKLIANSVYYPTLSANYNLRRSIYNKQPNDNQNIFLLTLTQVLYDAGKFNRTNQTDLRIDGNRLSVIAARQQLIINIAQRWTEALLAENHNKLSVTEVDSSKKILDKAKQSFQVGIGKKLDFVQAEAAYKLSIATQIQRQSNYIVARQNLSHLTGINITTLPTWHQPTIVVNTAESYVKKLKNNLTIQNQLKALDSATVEIKTVSGQLYPQINLQFSYAKTQYTEANSPIFQNPDDPLIMTLQFSWEFFSGFRTTANIEKAHALLNQQRAQLKSTILQQKTQLNTIMAQLQADEKRIPAISQQVEAAKISYEAFLQGYEVGTEDLPNVITAQRDYQKAQISLIESTYKHWLNYLKFKFIIGQITPEDL